MNASANELAKTWLRDKANGLRHSAGLARSAYRHSEKMVAACTRVARAYERAAAVLDEEAHFIERDEQKENP